MKSHDVDVVVLGSGLAGSMLATILARSGRTVTMIERGSHPRLAIGESLVPASAMLFWYLGQKFDVPEIRTLAHLDSISRNVAPTSGVKRGFSYVYHRPGQARVNPAESSLFIGPLQPVFRESQLYRQDIDHYLVRTAVDYGVAYHDNTTVIAVDIDADRVKVMVEDGSEVTARYVVDASGRNSVLASTYGLREEPSRLRHHSRTIFTHMTGVRPFEAVEPGAEGKSVSDSFSKGTLHHVFDGGWFWVIPFDNYHLSENNLVSVGLTIDSRRFPRDEGIEPEKEFAAFVERFPVVERHLGPAVAARPFVGTDRIQYSSTTSVGDRFLLLQHAYGFIDPLFSRGIWRSQEAIDVVADELLDALDDDDLSADRFADIDTMQRSMLDDNDQMVHNAYRSMADYHTWTSWLRIWFADEFLTTIPLLAATFRCVAEGDLSPFNRMNGQRRPATGFSYSANLQYQIDEAEGDLDRFEAGELTASEARERICERLAATRYLPHNLLDFEDPWLFGMDLTPPRLARLLWWGHRRAPKAVRRELFDFSIPALLRLQILDALPERLAGDRLKRDGYGNIVPQVSWSVDGRVDLGSRLGSWPTTSGSS